MGTSQLQLACPAANLTAIATIRLCLGHALRLRLLLPSSATRDAPLTSSPSLTPSRSPRFSLSSSSTSLRLRAAAAATSERIAASEFVNGARFLALSLWPHVPNTPSKEVQAGVSFRSIRKEVSA